MPIVEHRLNPTVALSNKLWSDSEIMKNCGRQCSQLIFQTALHKNFSGKTHALSEDPALSPSRPAR